MINLAIENIENCFCLQIERAAQTFSSHEENQQVYAFCLDLDIENGGYRVSWNTQSAFDDTVAEYRQGGIRNYNEQELNGVSGIKYNSGDFSYHLDELDDNDDGLDLVLSGIMDQLIALYDEKGSEFYQQYYHAVVEKEMVSCAARAILRSQAALRQFDLSANFIAFVTLHDADDEHLLGIMRQTTDEALLDKIFA